MFCPFHIIVCRSQKLGYHTLDIVSDITCFCQGGRISDRKWHIQKTCQGLHQVGFSGTGRSDHQHIGFLNLHIIAGWGKHSFIMIVNRYRHDLFRMLLSDDVFIQTGFDHMGRRDVFDGKFLLRGLFLFFFLHPLLFGNLILKAGQIYHAYVRHVVQHIVIVYIAVVHRIEAFLHTLRTDVDPSGQADHFSCFTLGTPAHEADLFVFVFPDGILLRAAGVFGHVCALFCISVFFSIFCH